MGVWQMSEMVPVLWQVDVRVDARSVVTAALPDARLVSGPSVLQVQVEIEAGSEEEAVNLVCDAYKEAQVVGVLPAGPAGQAGFAEMMAYAKAVWCSEFGIDDLDEGLPKPDTVGEALELLAFLDEVYLATGLVYVEAMDAARLLAEAVGSNSSGAGDAPGHTERADTKPVVLVIENPQDDPQWVLCGDVDVIEGSRYYASKYPNFNDDEEAEAARNTAVGYLCAAKELEASHGGLAEEVVCALRGLAWDIFDNLGETDRFDAWMGLTNSSGGAQ